MKYTKIIILSVFVFAIIAMSPDKIFAATINASSDGMISAGDTSIIGVYLNTENELINTVDGTLELSDEHNGNFEVTDFSIVSSALTMWPRKPSLESGNKISFVGGVPNGIKGDHLLLFRIIVKINDKGHFTIKPSSINAYLSDGLATQRTISKSISSIVVGPASSESNNKWQDIISKDNTAPISFQISLMQDSSLYDGKKFLLFDTNDTESGINYYEVREGNYPTIRTGNTYVLINQDSKIDVTVTAYDKAGNFQIATYKEREPIHWMSIFVTLIIIFVLYRVVRKIIRKRKNAKKII